MGCEFIMKKINKNILLFVLMTSILMLSGCKKKIEDKPSDWGVGKEIIETSAIETTEADKFNVSDQNVPGYEITKSADEIKEEISKEIESKVAEIEATRDSEQESKEAAITNMTNPDTGDTESLLDMEDPIISKLTDDIISGAINNEKEIDKVLSTTDYSDAYKQEIRNGCQELLSYWAERNKKLAADPIDPRLVEDNEDWRFYTQTEYEQMKAAEEQRIQEAGGNIEKHITEWN